MDTTDRPDKMLPARRSIPIPTPRAAAADAGAPPPPNTSAADLSFRLAWRAFRRHWWQAALLWLFLSSGLVALAYTRIKPSFNSYSRIKVENTSFSVLTDKNVFAPIDFGQYMETLVSNISSPTVIGDALARNPQLSSLPMLRGAADPVSVIRKALRVFIVDKTSLIEIGMSSQSPREAADIINTIVDTFLKLSEDIYDRSTQKQIDRLTEESENQRTAVEKKRELISQLAKKIDVTALEGAKDRNVTSLESYRQLVEERTRVEILRIQSEVRLNQLRNEKVVPPRALDEEALREQVVQAFYDDPQVGELQRAREAASVKLADAERLSRNPADPSRVRAVELKASLDKRVDDLWKKLEPRIRAQLVSTPVDESQERRISDAEAELSALKIQEEKLSDRLEKVRIENRAAESEALQMEFLKHDLTQDEEVYKKVLEALNQLKFDARSPIARIELEFKATPSFQPDGNLRNQVMAAIPFVTGLSILIVLLLMEQWGGRVADPDELSNRMKLRVIGVVPPLPQIKAPGPREEGAIQTAADLKAQRQLDEFVQSLDHLRVALCARRDQWGRDKHCVLITSACGSEGKTTLAAQLAERCVNAGLMTLLIDADLRNPTLSRMLDAQDNPGLINVLRGEANAEDVVMVIGDAGGFHLLPSGNPRMEPSRLLASDRLGKLLARARESFDMIIIDAPPVLPVPDALTIGRLTDGAVLAVRYDTSRFPLVERAHSRLTHVGVPIIGAVLNGVRPSDSVYGGYYPYGSYGSTYGNLDPGPIGNGSGSVNGNGKGSKSSPSDD